MRLPSGPLSDPGDDFYDVRPDPVLRDCPECDGAGWVWGYVGDEATQEACPRCVQRTVEQRTRRKGEGHAA